MVDETIIGFMGLITPPTNDPYEKFNYCNFLLAMIDT